MRRSRLSRRLENNSRNSIILSIVGIGIVLFLLFKFGLPALVNLSLFVSGIMNPQTEDAKKNNPDFIAAPVLNPLPNATNSAQTKVSGKSFKDYTIRLFINDEPIDKKETDKDGNFSFDDVTLKKGENIIAVKAVTKDEKESDFSQPFRVVYKSEAPTLSIDSPSEGQSFPKDQNTIPVTGKTDPGNRVFVNDFWAIVDGEGKYTYNLKLNSGENTINVVATDNAGNKKEESRKVTYNP